MSRRGEKNVVSDRSERRREKAGVAMESVGEWGTGGREKTRGGGSRRRCREEKQGRRRPDGMLRTLRHASVGSK